ncbi:GNAT family N-acetyltransferase [Enterococcus italicus]|uniref:GNAT family N-acetyltransferase n=1 Tax=Enterococcus italicus TaxID=246144 RepID=UPI003FA244AE
MTQEIYDHYLSQAIVAYAEDKVQAKTWAQEEALALSTTSFAELLPAVLATPNHFLFSLQLDEGQTIGSTWLFVKDTQAFIYDFEITATKRGQEYGKQALKAVDQWAATQGITGIGLHVFAHNQTAYHLYKKNRLRRDRFLYDPSCERVKKLRQNSFALKKTENPEVITQTFGFSVFFVSPFVSSFLISES